MYDELVKRLRYCSEEKNGCEMCALSSDCVLHVGLLTQAADAIEKRIKMPTPAMPFFLSCNCEEKYERIDCANYDEEQDMGAHIPFCRLYRRSGYCPCLGCEKYERKVKLPEPPEVDKYVREIN